MENQEELKKRILEQESQIKSIEDKLVVLKNEILEETQAKINNSNIRTKDLDILKHEILKETKTKREKLFEKARKDTWQKLIIIIAVITLFLTMIGYIGYENLQKTIADIAIKKFEISRNTEIDNLIIEIESLIKKGNVISKRYDNDEKLGREDFIKWKDEIVGFLEFSKWAGQSQIDNITNVFKESGDNYKATISVTNSRLEGFARNINTKKNSTN